FVVCLDLVPHAAAPPLFPYTTLFRSEASGKLANYFVSVGLKAGDCIAGLLPRTPELLITILATWRMGAIYQPLFTAFESKAIEQDRKSTRLNSSHVSTSYAVLCLKKQ